MSKSQFKLSQKAKYYFNLSYIFSNRSQFKKKASDLTATAFQPTPQEEKHSVTHPKSLGGKSNITVSVHLSAAELL